MDGNLINQKCLVCVDMWLIFEFEKEKIKTTSQNADDNAALGKTGNRTRESTP